MSENNEKKVHGIVAEYESLTRSFMPVDAFAMVYEDRRHTRSWCWYRQSGIKPTVLLGSFWVVSRVQSLLW